MFGVSFGEFIVIGIVGLIVFGPEKLPHIAAQVGRFMAEMRRTSDSFRREFYNSVYTPADDIKRDMARLTTELPKAIANPDCPDTKQSSETAAEKSLIDESDKTK